MATSRAELLAGAEYEGWEGFCDTLVNYLKNHWHQSDPRSALTQAQPGMIASDEDDYKLWHKLGPQLSGACWASGEGEWDEILQANMSCDTTPKFKGVDFYDECCGDYAVIKAVNEPGLGHRLTIGLDETTRTIVICDLGDVDVDLGLGAAGNPTVYLFNWNTNLYSSWDFKRFYIYNFALNSTASTIYFSNLNPLGFQFEQIVDVPSGNLFDFVSQANIELTDDNAEQAWIYLEPKINQSLTAGYIALLIDVTETSLGDASAGAGYNALFDMRVSGVTQFGIQNDGKIMTNQFNGCSGAAPGLLLGELPIYDGDGNFLGYIAVYDSIC